MPLDRPQGTNKRLPKSLAGTPEAIVGAALPACRRSSGDQSGKFAVIKRHPNIGTSPHTVLPRYAEGSGLEPGELNILIHLQGAGCQSCAFETPQSKPGPLGLWTDGKVRDGLRSTPPRPGSHTLTWSVWSVVIL